jgi:hypothetical protein
MFEMSNHSLEPEDSDDRPTLNLDSIILQQLASSRLDRNCVSTRRLSSGHNNEIHLLQFDNGVWDKLTIENKKSILGQIVNILFEIWTKCQFKEIGCLYIDSLDPIQEGASYLRRFVPFNCVFKAHQRF